MGVTVRDLRVAVGSVTVVRGLSMRVADGERVGLIGRSGSGKSMIVRAMLGLLPAGAVATGSVTVGGVSVIGASEPELARIRGSYVGSVFQNPSQSLNPVMTVAGLVGYPLSLHYALNRRERRRRVAAMLQKVGLPKELSNTHPGRLSGGQRQRVAIAAALITSPRLIVADEPTTALDAITQRRIINLLASLVADAGASLLLVTHDFSVLAHVTDRCYVLDEGRIIEEAGTTELLRAPETPPARRLVEAARALTLAPPRPSSRRSPPVGDEP